MLNQTQPPSTETRRASRAVFRTMLTRTTALALTWTALVASPLFGPALHAQATTEDGCRVSGRVLNTDGGAVSGATITALPAASKATSDEKGHFCLETVPTGTVRLLVVAEGYLVADSDLTLEEDRPARLQVNLQPAFGHEMVVTATRTEKRLQDVPIQLQVINREKIEKVAARNLADAVEWTPGIRVESNCQNCNESKIRMLGLEGAYSQILVDGQPTVSSLALVYGIEQLPARMIESIEVVKGGSSALYGAGAVGGVINLIPHQPSHTSGEVELRFGDMQGEEIGSYNGFFDWASGDRSRSVSLYAQTDRTDALDITDDGFTEVSRRELDSFGLRFDAFFLGDSARLAVESNKIEEDRRGGDQLWLPPDEALLAEEILTDRLGSSVSWIHTLGPRTDYRLVASYADTERDSYYGAGMDPNAFGTTDNPHAVVDAQVNHYRGPATLTWGLQYTRDEVLDVQLSRDRVIDETYTNTGLFIQEDRKVGKKVSVLYGVRVDDHSAVADAIVSPRAAVMWSPRTDLTVRTSVARGFRPPVVFDEDLHISLLGGGQAQVIRNDPNLTEETSTNTMVSAAWTPTVGRKGSASVELSLFSTGIDDLFLDVEEDNPSTSELEFTKINLGEARVEGVEMVLSYRWGSAITAEVAFVEQSARFSEPEPDFGSRDFFRTPERYGMATLQWRTRPVDVFVGALFTGSMKAKHFAGFIDQDRLETTPTFLTWDINLSRTFDLAHWLGGGNDDAGWPLTVTVGVKNLTDEFQEDLDQGPDRDASYTYGPRFPRSYFTSVKVGF